MCVSKRANTAVRTRLSNAAKFCAAWTTDIAHTRGRTTARGVELTSRAIVVAGSASLRALVGLEFIGATLFAQQLPVQVLEFACVARSAAHLTCICLKSALGTLLAGARTRTTTT